MDHWDPQLMLAEICKRHTPESFPWLAHVRSQCFVFHHLPPDIASALSVTFRLSGDSPSESAALRIISQLLAREFCMAASVHIDLVSASVRFSREPSDPGPPPADPRRGSP
jgi:hypothetical protein